MAPETILFVGDSHGDAEFIDWAIDRAVRFECDHIVQVGDFGYWEHRANGIDFLDIVNYRLAVAGKTLHWVDGNHENHTLLRRKYGPREDGMVEIRENIIYIPRGTRWEWGGVSFLGIGGAHSIDKDSRSEGESWWPEELVTAEEVQRCVSDGPVDVVVAHDVPMFVDLSPHLWRAGVRPWGWAGPSAENRSRLAQVFDGVRPKVWAHGHYHLQYTDSVDNCTFIGLDANVNQYRSKSWSWNQAIHVLSTSEVK